MIQEIDPRGLDAHDPGAKLDVGKPKMSLLLDFSKALLAVGEVSTYGEQKYSRGGWKYVDDGFNRYTDAMLRHLMYEHEEFDSDSGLYHVAQVAWNALARLELFLQQVEKS